MNRFFTNCRKKINSEKKLKDDNYETHRTAEVTYLSKELQRKLGLAFTKIKAAEIKPFRYLQNDMFSVPKKKLSSFKTMKNENGLCVLKTKIFNRVDDPNFLSPILLNNNHDIIHMLIRESHKNMGHATMGLYRRH